MWIIVQYLHVGRINVTSLYVRVLVGLVGIMLGCGFVDSWTVAIIGVIAAVICYFNIIFMRKRKDIDDALDVMSVHRNGDIRGAIAVGIFLVVKYS